MRKIKGDQLRAGHRIETTEGETLTVGRVYSAFGGTGMIAGEMSNGQVFYLLPWHMIDVLDDH